MAKKIIGWTFIFAGVGNFIRNFAKASEGRPDAFNDIDYGIFFLGLGIYLVSTSKKKDASSTTPTKQP
jgi:hypothetical protein